VTASEKIRLYFGNVPGHGSFARMLNPSFVPFPKFQSNISLYQIISGFFFGLLAQPFVKTARIISRYPRLLGRYSMQKERSDGTTEAEDGEILIKLNWWRGSFAVTALHATRKEQWKGEMHLSLDMRNVGNGIYWHVDEAKGVGDQRFRYLPEKRQFRVQGITFGASQSQPFFHLWTKK
jgi:hypothetical protein